MRESSLVNSLSFNQFKMLEEWINGLPTNLKERYEAGNILIEFEFEPGAIGPSCDVYLVEWTSEHAWDRMPFTIDITDYDSW